MVAAGDVVGDFELGEDVLDAFGLGGGAGVEEVAGDEEEGGLGGFVEFLDEALEEGDALVVGEVEVVDLEEGEGFGGGVGGAGGAGPEAGGEEGAGADFHHLTTGEGEGHGGSGRGKQKTQNAKRKTRSVRLE